MAGEFIAKASLLDRFDDTVIIPALGQQMSLLGFEPEPARLAAGTYFDAPNIDLGSYDNIIVCMSDSIACLLALIDQGADMSRVEIWHHAVDGREGSSLMDWAFNDSYIEKFAEAFGLPVYFSWLKGGIEGEMLKENSYSQPHIIETPSGVFELERDTKRSQPATRRQFPQQSANLATRWCSSAAKIDVGRRALTNQDRFLGKKTLFVTGERRAESSNRAKYNQLEPHAVDRRLGRLGRHVDAWRPVLHFTEEMVWELIAKHRVVAPVPYRLGWSRSSCMTCVFNSPVIWATLRRYFPHRLRPIASYENEFDSTISRQRINVLDLSATAEAFEITDLEALAQAKQREYTLPIFTPAGQEWRLPAGAFGKEGCGSL
ncbi:Phosphoadenosine phosphosulfate reductase family protein [Pseudomonas oleovorans subsp. oleovorans]|uniref:Phosphoadenosine phosphosulfate reductase family n=1 Tax=Ectopseudomonas oleovorans TaxID=301 RepID=A0A379PNE6_ECTOL|nr:phosphoadenosine phosphosulfate reductase family protein [Pseudomonas oleovorans]OWK40039.1 Phosphoadenosine phosphosulfate reductase family protein [Pseudomonas oleovorans subsp. oleovorans]SEJ97203.1 Phosphoadenosine phosphosulfate reductase family protein [Pseudomonas oleovorans]SUE72632.1 Phosphoadenosine phosphosulfate reductase family [Pseudomonas oleovorans]